MKEISRCHDRERRVIGQRTPLDEHFGKGRGLSWQVLGVREDLLKTCKDYELSSPVFLVFNYRCTCVCVHMGVHVSTRKRCSQEKKNELFSSEDG